MNKQLIEYQQKLEAELLAIKYRKPSENRRLREIRAEIERLRNPRQIPDPLTYA